MHVVHELDFSLVHGISGNDSADRVLLVSVNSVSFSFLLELSLLC